MSYVSRQVQKRRPLFFPKVTTQNTTRAPLFGKITQLIRHCRTAPLRQILECGHLRKRTSGETTTTLLYMRPQTERWDRVWVHVRQSYRRTELLDLFWLFIQILSLILMLMISALKEYPCGEKHSKSFQRWCTWVKNFQVLLQELRNDESIANTGYLKCKFTTLNVSLYCISSNSFAVISLFHFYFELFHCDYNFVLHPLKSLQKCFH